VALVVQVATAQAVVLPTKVTLVAQLALVLPVAHLQVHLHTLAVVVAEPVL
jgi:hypothetical protein